MKKQKRKIISISILVSNTSSNNIYGRACGWVIKFKKQNMYLLVSVYRIRSKCDYQWHKHVLLPGPILQNKFWEKLIIMTKGKKRNCIDHTYERVELV